MAMVNLILLILALQSAVVTSRQISRQRRQDRFVQPESTTFNQSISRSFTTASASLSGLRVESADAAAYRGFSNGILQIVADDVTELRLFGTNLSSGTTIKFSWSNGSRGDDCVAYRTTEIFPIKMDPTGGLDSVLSATMIVSLELLQDKEAAYYVCVSDSSGTKWIHQGSSPTLQLRTIERYLIPLWIQILLVIVLQCLSGLFSGLNLGLLSLDPTELQIVASVGASKEKKYAKHIIPLRQKGNFLLCSLVIGNVLVNSLLTILLDNLTSGLLAVVFSTIGIVLFGEIVPQALCNRFGLAIGSATRHITYVVMALTCVISWPLSRILDLLLGKEIGTVYDRVRLVELIRVTMDHNLLEGDEVNIISGALSLKRKTVADVMTPLADVFMLPYDAILDFDTLAEISRAGFTRIPVFENHRDNIVGLLNIKDLALLDPDDCTAVKTLCKYYSYEILSVTNDTTLDVMLEDFKKGRSHMAFIQQYQSEEDRDPVYETIGVVTLEDIIEEMIQAEIYDESDRSDMDRKLKPSKKDIPLYPSGPLYNSLVTPQLQHAAFQFLSTSIEPFRSEMISGQILRRLIRHKDVTQLIRRRPTDIDPEYIFQSGRPADYFVLILEGRVEVKVGFEGLVFESGPFTYFGVSALNIPPTELAQLRNTSFPALPSPRTGAPPRINLERTSPTGVFIPDFTVTAITDVLFLRIKRSHYVAAIRASSLEQQTSKQPPQTIVEDMFGQEMARLEVQAKSEDYRSDLSVPTALFEPNSTVDLPNFRTSFGGASTNGSSDDLEMTPVIKNDTAGS